MKTGGERLVLKRAHKLELYLWAVQHAGAEVQFLRNVHAHYRRGKGWKWARRLREDFAGTSAVAAAWAMSGGDQEAIAVEAHGATLRWARKRWRGELGERAGAVRFVEGDVRAVKTAKVDVVAALNFSGFIYHDRERMRGYLASVRKSLRLGGVMVMDAYGGAGAMRLGVQKRRVRPALREGAAGIEPFTYLWEQRAYDAVTQRVDCRIHFEFANGARYANAFRYDWRLWSLTELVELMGEAGFAKAEVWCDCVDARTGRGDGVYRPVERMGAREDWAAYVVGVR